MDQTWESNRAVRIENVGDTDVINPWLSNGHNDFRTVKEILDSAIKPGMTDAEKATAVWWQDCRHHYHGDATWRRRHGPRENLQRLRLLRVRG